MATWTISANAATGLNMSTSAGSNVDQTLTPPGDFDGATINSVTLQASPPSVTNDDGTKDDSYNIRWHVTNDAGVDTYGGDGSDAAAICYADLPDSTLGDQITAGGSVSPTPTTAVAADWDELRYFITYGASMKDDEEAASWSSFDIVVDYTAADLTASGNPDTPTVTASGTASKKIAAAGAAVTAAAVIAVGTAGYEPKVYLNSTPDLSGSPTEMTVTAANLAGTSITFTDPSGAPTGSLYLVVENRNNGDIGSIAVTVNASGTSASGTPLVDVTTASGNARLVLRATGTPNVTDTAASGTATLGPLTASGSPNTTETTASGTAGMRHEASGAPDIADTTASGVARLVLRATGTPNVADTTASGAADVAAIGAAGNPSVTEITASGTATLGALTASGTPNVADITASGVADVGPLTAFGSPSIADVTASGNARKEGLTAAGTPDVAATTASGTATLGALGASGNPSVDEVTASGTAGMLQQASGTPNVTEVTASGTASITGGALTAGGTPDTEVTTASGTATLAPLGAAGTPDTAETTAAGNARLAVRASGSTSIAEVTASGVADVGGIGAAGTPDTPTVTASGTATLGGLTASGSPPVETVTASGAARLVLRASGTPSTEETTASGVAAFAGQLAADGTPSVAEITAAGTATLGPLQASGSVQAPTTTASGTAAGPIPSVVSGGGGSMGHVPKQFRRPLKGLSLRSQPIKDEEIEEQIEEIIDEIIEEVESVEEQMPETKVPGQDIARIAARRALAKQDIVRNTRKAEKVSKKLAEAQLEARINELVRQRRAFFESENEDIQAILFILSELV